MRAFSHPKKNAAGLARGVPCVGSALACLLHDLLEQLVGILDAGIGGEVGIAERLQQGGFFLLVGVGEFEDFP
jgi:hypothetical protein